MQITISKKSPVYGKLISLGHDLNLDPSLLAAGMCHAALNGTEGQGTPADPAEDPAVDPAPAPAPTMPEPVAPAAAPSAGIFDTVA